MSDRTLSLEYGMVDTLAVLDAVGSRRALLFGFEDGGIISTVIAASRPDRVLGIVYFGAYARSRYAPDYPFGWSDAEESDFIAALERSWGTEEFWRWNLGEISPELSSDPQTIRAWARYSRLSASPDAIVKISEMSLEVDVRAVLPTIQVPALVLHRVGDRAFSIEHGRYLADHIPGASLKELTGDEHPPFTGDVDTVLRETDRFIDAIRHEEASFEGALATVLFTDIVGSTGAVARLGDRAWTELVERHHAVVRAMLARYGGTEIDPAGDGFFATFEGPVRAVRCAAMIASAVRQLGVEVRAGVHTGQVRPIDGKVGGIAVVIGSRIGAKAGASEVFVSQTVKDLVLGSGLTFDDAGEHVLKGVPDRWRLYRLVPADAAGASTGPSSASLVDRPPP